MQLTMQYPAAASARLSGLRSARRTGQTLRERYKSLLRERGPFSDHEAGSLLGKLSTTIGARRLELMAADPGCIEPVGRVVVGDRSRAVWRWAR